MTESALTSEQVALIHHVELSQSGWQTKVVEGFLVSALLSNSSPVSRETLMASIAASVVGEVSDATFERAIQRLRSTSSLVISDGLYSLTADARLEAQQKQSDFKALRTRARELFLEGASAAPDPSAAWNWFDTVFLPSQVEALGARTYDVLSNDGPSGLEKAAPFEVLARLPDDERPAMRSAATKFLGLGDPTVRDYVLSHLQARLLSLALRLPPNVTESLRKRASGGNPINIFLDTNFLFSLLDLHDHTANAAAQQLVRLLQALGKGLPVRIWVTPRTMDEARRTLIAHASRLQGLSVEPRVGRIAVDSVPNLGGITSRFFRAASSAKRGLRPEDFFGPYISDLLTIVRGKGIELFNESTESLATRQIVVDDILTQQQYEARKYGVDAKSFDALQHDMILWHQVWAKRPDGIDAPLATGHWIATIDYRFIAFDESKQRSLGRNVPLCIHPSVLIQLMELWMPSTPELDAALLSGIRSTLPVAFDKDAERVTVDIVRALSRYEIHDLPEDTILSILTNDALRARMRDEQRVEVQADLVRDQISEEVERLKQQLADARSGMESLERQLSEIDADRVARFEAQRRREAEHRDEIRAVNESLAAERQARESASADLQAANERMARRETDHSYRITRIWVSALAGVAAIALLAASTWVWRYSFPISTWPPAKRLLLLMGVLVAAAHIATRLCGRVDSLADWPARRRIQTATAWLFGGAAVGILGNAAYDALR